MLHWANFRLDLHAVRALAFGVLWIALGKRVWFFPNILAEEATLKELFQFWPQKDEGERPKWTARLFFAVVAVLVILLLRHHAPDEAARARYWLSTYSSLQEKKVQVSKSLYFSLPIKHMNSSLSISKNSLTLFCRVTKLLPNAYV